MNYLTADITKHPQFPPTPIGQRAQRALHAFNDPHTESLFQITGLENTSRSVIDQLDDLLVHEGHVGSDRHRFNLIRQVNAEDDDQDTGAQSTINNESCLYKLTLQDCDGKLFYAIELEKLNFLSGKNLKTGFPISLGSKLLVKGAEQSYGCLLLMQQDVHYLGGAIHYWNHELTQRHIAHLKQKLSNI